MGAKMQAKEEYKQAFETLDEMQRMVEAAAASDAPLITNQVEYHPFLSQQPLLTELRRRSMGLTAYAPLAQGRVPADDTLAAIAAPVCHGPGCAHRARKDVRS